MVHKMPFLILWTLQRVYIPVAAGAGVVAGIVAAAARVAAAAGVRSTGLCQDADR